MCSLVEMDNMQKPSRFSSKVWELDRKPKKNE